MRADSPILLTLGLSLTAAVLSVAAWGRFRSVEVPRPATWPGPVQICVRAGVDVAEVDQAVGWWRSRGHAVSRGCPGVEIWGDPAVDTRSSVDDPEVVHGHTRVQAAGDRIVFAEIRVVPDADALVVAHELGHALGYRHPRFAPTGHLMHPSRPGWDGRGLEGP